MFPFQIEFEDDDTAPHCEDPDFNVRYERPVCIILM